MRCATENKNVEWYVEMIRFTDLISVQECTKVSLVKSTLHLRRIGFERNAT